MMAEYSEVIREAKRMCWHYTQGGNHDKCPMYPACNASQCRKIAFDRPVDFEARVMGWSAEHPEPVYPTWSEWLQSMGLVEVQWNGPVLASMRIGIDDRDYILKPLKMIEPIPADIAQKLGLQPKEG